MDNHVELELLEETRSISSRLLEMLLFLMLKLGGERNTFQVSNRWNRLECSKAAPAAKH